MSLQPDLGTAQHQAAEKLLVCNMIVTNCLAARCCSAVSAKYERISMLDTRARELKQTGPNNQTWAT